MWEECANPLLPMEKECNTHDQTDVMNTLKECSRSYIFLDRKTLDTGTNTKALNTCRCGKQYHPHSDQIRSVAQSCPILCDPMNCSTPGLPVHHQLPEFTQTHVHQVSDAIQPSLLCRPLLLLPPIPKAIT